MERGVVQWSLSSGAVQCVSSSPQAALRALASLCTLEVNDLIFPNSDFLLVKMRSSSTSSPSMMAQLSAAGRSQSLRVVFITSLEYLYSSL